MKVRKLNLIQSDSYLLGVLSRHSPKSYPRFHSGSKYLTKFIPLRQILGRPVSSHPSLKPKVSRHPLFCARRGLAHIIIAIIVILFTFIAEESFAAPSYGTDMPAKGKWFKAWEVNIVFKRKLDKSYGRLKSNQYFLDLSYGLSDRLVLDFKIGAGSFDHKPADSYEIDYDTHFAGGYGFRVRVFDNSTRTVKGVLGFQHISVHPPTEKKGEDKNEAILDDWQISGLISKNFSLFTPYLGIKLSRCDIIHKLNGVRKRKKSREPFVGLVVGTDISLGERFKLNIEGRVIDETALSTRLSFLF